MFHQDLEDLLYFKDYALLDRNLSAMFLPNPIWAPGLLLAASSKRKGPVALDLKTMIMININRFRILYNLRYGVVVANFLATHLFPR